MSHIAPQELQSLFDSQWYIEAYPDVGRSSMPPLYHYQNFGWKEGRWPCLIEAVQLDNKIWANKDNQDALEALKSIANGKDATQKGLACWFVCRWLASQQKWKLARRYIDDLLNDLILPKFIFHEGPFLLAFTVLYKLGDRQSARNLLSDIRWGDSENKILAASMLQKGELKIKAINEVFHRNNLLQLDPLASVDLDSLHINPVKCELETKRFSPLVTVIIPCFNAEKTILTALKSLLAQTYSKLEVIVIDDASTDGTPDKINEIASRDTRIKYVRLNSNSGAYAARNKGLELSNGKFLTTHDADDWSHPQKIEMQVAELQKNRKIKAVVTHWVRTSPGLDFERWRIEDGWIYRNVSSLMFRRGVFRKLGFWDTVSVNADTEYYLRIQKKFTPSSIKEILPGIPLSLGRVDENSLTQTNATHLRTQFGGIRKDYIEQAICWHNSSRRLYMPKNGFRKFLAPPHICRGSEVAKKDNLRRTLELRNLFDSKWYLATYPDIGEAGVNPIKHFIEYGIEEGRDPNPYLSITGLSYILKKSNFEVLSLWASGPIDELEILSVKGASSNENKTHIIMIGHLAGKELFGAERSFLDCIKMLHTERTAISVILPSGTNPQYIKTISQYVHHIFFTPLPWWRNGREEVTVVTERIRKIINQTNASAVYVNTLTLWEPHIAAKKERAQSIMHVRELPKYDNELCARLNATSDEIREHVDRHCDLIIANSNTTAECINLKNKTKVIYNSIEFNDRSLLRESDELHVVMLSSNIEKKGVEDFFKIAKEITDKKIHFHLFGPETPFLKKLIECYCTNNIQIHGYTEDTKDAFNGMDIVLSLSHFQESFGRTIIEGMASGCVPIGYAWGAIKEIIDQEIGFVVEYKAYRSVARLLETLLANKSRLKKLQNEAYIRAKNTFDHRVISSQLNEILKN